MKLTFTWPAYILDRNDEPISPPARLHGFHIEANLHQYLDFDIADLGVIGGDVDITVQNESAELSISYWAPACMENGLKERLLDYSHGQLEDGFGECGIEFQSGKRKLRIYADTESPAHIHCEDDGRFVPPPSQIAIAAREGNLKRLKQALRENPSAIDATLMGYTGLHFAILYGHCEAALLLLNAGANPNAKCPHGGTLLQSCALARDLNDDDATAIALQLLRLGADASVESDGETALSYAENRGKKKLAELLRKS